LYLSGLVGANMTVIFEIEADAKPGARYVFLEKAVLLCGHFGRFQAVDMPIFDGILDNRLSGLDRRFKTRPKSPVQNHTKID
jgi:hypothetical protein